MLPDDNDPDRSTQPLYNTRRQVLAGSAGALGVLALGGAFAAPAAADDDEYDEAPEMIENEFEDDIEILNFARTLEALEFRFYEQGLDNISEDELTDSDVLSDFGDPITDNVYDYLGTIRDHEEIHFEVLGAVVEELDGDPVDEPEFDFGSTVEEPDEFIATAIALEDTGVSAYAGAAPFIENEDLVPPALSIHSVEARHASFLRVLDKEAPFPAAFDPALSKSDVLDIASQFIVDED